jgi:hypothetical protein
MKALHVTHHAGCASSIASVCSALGIPLETRFAGWNYNVGEGLAAEIYAMHRDLYESFDLVITSDTAPLSRIFLQNAYPGRLLVWVCNRFDYYDGATNDCGFPDPGYHELFKSLCGGAFPNAKVFSYTAFEHEYAAKYRGFAWGGGTLKPFIFNAPVPDERVVTEGRPRFFVPPYHNDTWLSSAMHEAGIPHERGRYDGPRGLSAYDAVVHFPYAWSNLALFEALANGVPYVVPTARFLREESTKFPFFWSPPMDWPLIGLSEWYDPVNAPALTFFDSWAELSEVCHRGRGYFQGASRRARGLHERLSPVELEKWRGALLSW